MASLSDEISSRRTFAIISHPDAGKTTLTEKLLLYTGSIQTAGSVKGKSSAKHAVSDWMDIEKERGISVTSSVLQFTYNGACVNILDTPGHQDFSEDTYRTLMAADAAVMVIDGAKGVEAQTKKLFKVCTLRHIPIFTFVNKLDHEARDPFELMEEIENVLGINTYPMNWPIGSGRNFRGVFDRQTSRVIAFEGDGHANATKKVAEVEAELGDPSMDELIGEENHKNLMDDIELLDGGGAEGIGRTDHDVLAAGSHSARDLADCRGLAGTVNTHKQHAARRVRERIALDGHKMLLELLGQGATELRGGLEVLLGRGIAQVIGDLDGDLGAHVTHDEGVLQVLPKILVDLTAKVEDLVEGLAASLKSARESIEESHYAFTTFPVSRSSFCETTRLTPSACIETP